MNILVVNPPNRPFTNKSILAEPIDVLQIATIIKSKYSDVNVIDMDVNRMNNNINYYLKDDNIIIFVFDYQLPLHTSDTISNMFEIIKNTNKKLANQLESSNTNNNFFNFTLSKDLNNPNNTLNLYSLNNSYSHEHSKI